MRIGVTGDFGSPGLVYRAIAPLEEMARRGHEVVWPTGENGQHTFGDLAACDVLHVYRSYDQGTWRAVRSLLSEGVALTWDSDDDPSAYSEQLPAHVASGRGLMHQAFRESVVIAKLAQAATFPTQRLADVYASEGVERVEVIDSAVRGGFVPRRVHGDQIVIGWVAADGHATDFQLLGLAETLRQIQLTHPNVHVEAIGVDLGLGERYSHTPAVPFDELPRRIAGFDIGLAPLADVPYNHSRSDIKIKEYAAAGIPWLASPRTPYVSHATGHGGQLVADDGWFDALDQLVRRGETRAQLGAEGHSWGRTQRIAGFGDRWEAVFTRALTAARNARVSTGWR